MKQSLLFIIVFVVLQPFPTQAVEKRSLSKSCYSNKPIYAVPACETLIESNDANYKVYFQLAKLYQKQNQLEKAKMILERAVADFNERGDYRTAHKTAKAKSNIDEEIWKQSQNRTSDVLSQHRVKCIKFSRILPKKALESCNQYLLENPEDAEIKSYRYAAQDAIANKGKQVYASNGARSKQSSSIIDRNTPKKEQTRVSKNKNTSKSVLDRDSEEAVAVVQPKKKPVSKKVSKSKNKVVAQSEKSTESNSQEVDPDMIADIKKELSGLYALLQKQQQEQAALLESRQKETRGVDYKEFGDRYALVVGNANYSPVIGKLKNPVNDAVDIGAQLKKMDFNVKILTDGNLQKMERAVDELSRKIQPDDTVLFYYAGHGVAIDGENYLLPTKMGIKDEVDVKYKSLNLSYVLDKLDRGIRGVTMIILDACRNNPFPSARSANKGGLVQSSGPFGTLIAYSTAPGEVAIDGSGRNGLYTKHLLQEMKKPNIKLEDVFKKVRVSVGQETQGSQVPWENSSLSGDFYFVYND